MKKAIKFLAPLVLLALGCGTVQAQMLVSDPMAMAAMAAKFLKEIEQWKQQVTQWGKVNESWAQELLFFGQMKEQWGKDNELFKKLLSCQEVNNLIFSQFLGGVGDGFGWEDLRLNEIMEIIEGPLFKAGAGSDPYQGLFTKGLKIAEVFPQIRDWSEIEKSDKYKNNTDYQSYIKRIMEEQKKMLDDLEIKIAAIAKLNNLVPEREKKYQEIQKRLETYTQAGGTVNLPKLWILSAELNMELCREMFHLVLLGRIETENLLLDELRSLSERKGDEKFEDQSKDKDKAVVVGLFTEKNGGEP